MFDIKNLISFLGARIDSTFLTTLSVSPRLLPLGVSIVIRNCGNPALGKRLKPIGLIRKSDNMKMIAATETVLNGFFNDQCKALP